MKTDFLRKTLPALMLALSISLTACGQAVGSGETGAAPSVETTAAPETMSTSVHTESTESTASIESTTEVPSVSPELAQLRADLEPSAAIAAIVYLGIFDGEPQDDAFYDLLAAQGYLERYPFLTEITQDRYIRTEGSEVYCLIPADPAATVTVSEWDERTGEGTTGQVLYSAPNGAPLFLQGNISDIMPNLSVTIVNSYGHILENFHPFLSLRDGRIAIPDGTEWVMDLTAYESGSGEDAGPVQTFDLYYPDTDGSSLSCSVIEYSDLNEYIVLQLLIDYGVVPDSVTINAFESGDDYLLMDLSSAFTDYLLSLSEAEQELVLASVVNSYLCAYGCRTISLTADAAPVQIGSDLYADPISFFAA